MDPREYDRQEALSLAADAVFGEDWEQRSLPTEDQRFISENDVLNPDETVIAGYGSDHRFILSFGRNDE